MHTIIQHCYVCKAETYSDTIDQERFTCPDCECTEPIADWTHGICPHCGEGQVVPEETKTIENKYDDVCRNRTCCEQAYGRKVS